MSLGIENNRFQKIAQLRQSQQELELERPKHQLLVESLTMDYPDNQCQQDGRFRVPFMQPKLMSQVKKRASQTLF